MLLPASNIWANGGWSWRVQEMLSADDLSEIRKNRRKGRLKGCLLSDFYAGKPGKDAEGNPRCNLKAQTNILVMGDSHTADGYNTLHAEYGDDESINIIFVPRDGGEQACLLDVTSKRRQIISQRTRPDCKRRLKILNTMEWNKIDIVVIDVFDSQKRYYKILNHLLRNYPDLKGIVIGSYFGTRPNRCLDLANKYRSFNACKEARFVSYFKPNEWNPKTDVMKNVLYIDKIKLFCGDEKRLENCITTVSDGTPVFFDGDHFTEPASRD